MTKAAPLARSGLSEADWLAPVWPNYERSVPMTALILASTRLQISAGAHRVLPHVLKSLIQGDIAPTTPGSSAMPSQRKVLLPLVSAQSATRIDEALGAGLKEAPLESSRSSDALGRRVERVSVHRNATMPCMETHRKPGRPSKGHRVTIAGKVPAPIKDAAQQRAAELGMSTNDYLASLVSADTGVSLHTERRIGI
jgi:hypothetical protein